MKKKLTIQEITQSGDAYEVANWLAGLEPGDTGYNSPAAAGKAAQLMKKAGWKFITYNEFGEEVWRPPGQKESANV